MKIQHFLLRPAEPVLAFVAVLLIASAVWAAAIKRSHPPKWDDAQTSEVFFPDARQALVGPRPTAASAAGVAEGSSSGSSDGGTASGAAGGNFAWSHLISSDTLESEVKTTVRQLGDTLKTTSAFTGGGYQDARREFSDLAVMFAIIAGYDSDVRWKQAAGSIRPLVSRAGFNCKVGTDLSYREAKARQDDLDKLVRGDASGAAKETESFTWDKVAGRPPLMQRLDRAQRQGLSPWTADAAAFQKNGAQFLHEAELIAAISEVIGREGFEYSDDETYLEYTHTMRDAAVEAAEAARQKNFDGARKAVGTIEKTCNSCHESYRS
ncbi:MAG TPA: cytochrome c [Pirellulales bacterium]|nr:cytochrome c [Pirellulales bacterium]